MKFSVMVTVLVLVLVAVFSAANWNTLTAPVEISLLFTNTRGPLGLFMIGVVVALTTLYFGFLVYLQTTMLLESRRHSRELSAQRELADKAEASRLTELHAFLDTEFKALHAHLDSAQQGAQAAMEQSANSLSACIGELEDRVVRKGGSLNVPEKQ